MSFPKERLRYFIMVLAVIGLGLLSRKLSFLPLWTGDALYAVMVYFGICLLWPTLGPKKVLAFSFFCCLLVETSQLYHAAWLVSIRKTTFGHLVLGEGFLWSDVLAYALGCITAFLADVFFFRKLKPANRIRK